MSFKCPICLKDFQRNKLEWKKHINEAHSSAGEKIRILYEHICECTEIDHCKKCLITKVK